MGILPILQLPNIKTSKPDITKSPYMRGFYKSLQVSAPKTPKEPKPLNPDYLL
jgi:hypothetical protein